MKSTCLKKRKKLIEKKNKTHQTKHKQRQNYNEDTNYSSHTQVNIERDVSRNDANFSDLVNIAELSVRRVIAMAKQVNVLWVQYLFDSFIFSNMKCFFI